MARGYGSETEMLNADDEFLENEFAVLKAVMAAIASAQNSFMSAEFTRIVKDPAIKEHLDDVMPYLYAAAFLSFAGREIDENTMDTVLKTIGFAPDSRIIRKLSDAGVKSHLIYVYTYYFLLAFGKIADAENIMKMVNALGIHADEGRVNDVLTFIKAPKKV